MSAFLTGVPGFQNGMYMLVNPRLAHRTAVNINDDHRFAELMNLLDQFQLHSRQGQ
ncbi:hypothetical protein D3C75_630990 [compost metagenome]